MVVVYDATSVQCILCMYTCADQSLLSLRVMDCCESSQRHSSHSRCYHRSGSRLFNVASASMYLDRHKSIRQVQLSRLSVFAETLVAVRAHVWTMPDCIRSSSRLSCVAPDSVCVNGRFCCEHECLSVCSHAVDTASPPQPSAFCLPPQTSTPFHLPLPLPLPLAPLPLPPYPCSYPFPPTLAALPLLLPLRLPLPLPLPLALPFAVQSAALITALLVCSQVSSFTTHAHLCSS